MIDIKFLRENPEIVKQNIKNKFQDSKLGLVDEVIALDAESRKVKGEADSLRASRNKNSKMIGALMAQGKRDEAEEMKKQVSWDAKYDRCTEIAMKRVEYYGSIPEMMVAIQLLYLGYGITPQQTIGKYRVDFLIPKAKIVLEIDGKIFHTKQNQNREAIIQLSLGLDWTIIHIPAELIRKDILKLNLILQHRGK